MLRTNSSNEKKRVAYIYNPMNQTETELRESFVIRHREFYIIYDDIKTSSISQTDTPIIIQGQRGQGKTTMLLKLFYEIRADDTLNSFIIPVIFNEEQYHIANLFGLWASTAERLEEENDAFTGLYNQVEEQYDVSGTPEEAAFACLEAALKEQQKKAVLLIDNIGQLLDKLVKKDQQRLREVLITSPYIWLIGASSLVLEATYDYSKPFYEMFKIVRLDGLKKNEAENLMVKLGEHFNIENIDKIVKSSKGRIETLRRLCGGVPRTMVLLFEIFLDHESSSAFEDLELILDRVTPLYKHRMDDLSAQQQPIVDAIALNWDAIPTKDIAKRTRLQSKVVSAQLKLLEKNKIINKIKTDKKNFLYQITERFFNIWYLMRYGRKRGREQVKWLVKFLDNWCSTPELEKKVHQHLDGIEKGNLNPRHVFIITEALASTKIPRHLQSELLHKTRSYLEHKDRNFSKKLSKSDHELLIEGYRLMVSGKSQQSINTLNSICNKNSLDLFMVGYQYATSQDYIQAEKYFRSATELGDWRSKTFLAIAYFALKMKKEEALKIIEEIVTEEKGEEIALTFLPYILLWNEKIEQSINCFKKVLANPVYESHMTELLFFYARLLLAKKQYHTLFNFLKELPIEYKDRLKPIHYALMYHMQDEYPDEYKKMGAELKETVEEIIEEVNQMAIDYA